MAAAAILNFEIPVFGSMRLLEFRIRWYMWSLTVVVWAVEKLLRYLFSVGNALKVPKIGVLGILGVKTEICIFMNPKRHLLMREHAFWRITRPNRSTIMAAFGCTSLETIPFLNQIGPFGSHKIGTPWGTSRWLPKFKIFCTITNKVMEQLLHALPFHSFQKSFFQPTLLSIDPNRPGHIFWPTQALHSTPNGALLFIRRSSNSFVFVLIWCSWIVIFHSSDMTWAVSSVRLCRAILSLWFSIITCLMWARPLPTPYETIWNGVLSEGVLS